MSTHGVPSVRPVSALLLVIITMSNAITSNEARGRCTFEGVRADPDDCHLYVQCEEGLLYEYSCGPAAAFHPRRGSCVSPIPHGRCDDKEATTTTDKYYQDKFKCVEDGYYPLETDCGKFYRCIHGRKYAFSCLNGMYFDRHSSKCRVWSEGGKAQCPQGLKNSETPGPHDKDSKQSPQYNRIPSLIEDAMKSHHHHGGDKYHSDGNGQGKEDNNEVFGMYWDHYDGEDIYLDAKELNDGTVESTTTVPAVMTATKKPSWRKNDHTDHSHDINPKSTGKSYSSNRGKLYEKDTQFYKIIKSRKNTSRPVVDDKQTNKVHTEEKKKSSYNKPTARELPADYIEDNQVSERFIHYKYKYKPTSRNADSRARGPVRKRTGSRGQGRSGPGPRGEGPREADPRGSRRNNRRNRPESKRLSPTKFVCPSNGYFRVEKDCSHFYHCAGGRAHRIRCNEGLVFNAAKNICDWPYMVPECMGSDVIERPILARFTSSIDKSRTGTDSSKTTKSSNNRDFAKMAKVEPEEASRRVPLLTNMCLPGSYRRDMNDCRAFYICGQDGRELAFKCPQQLLFSVEHGYCRKDRLVKDCQENKPQPHKRVIRSTEEETCEEGGRWPHPHDCHLYLQCEKSKLQQRLCHYPMAYNPATSKCDDTTWACTRIHMTPKQSPRSRWSQVNLQVQHRLSMVKPQRQGWDHSRARQYRGGNDLQAIPTSEAWSPIPILSDDSKYKSNREWTGPSCKSDGFFADAKDCQKFYYCFQGERSDMKCEDKLVYNRYARVCDHQWNVDECTADLTENDANRVITLMDQVSRRDPSGSKSSLTPSQQDILVKRKDADYQVSVYGRSAPDHDIKSSTRDKKNRGPDKRCSYDRVFADPNNCSIYYQCEKGHIRKQHCPRPLVYNKKRQLCDLPYKVSGCSKPMTQKPSSNVRRQRYRNKPEGRKGRRQPINDVRRNPQTNNQKSGREFPFTKKVDKSVPVGRPGMARSSPVDWQVKTPDKDSTALDRAKDTPINTGSKTDGSRCVEGHRVAANRKSCRLYYQCTNGHFQRKLCPEGLAFDAGRRKCYWDSLVTGCASILDPL